MTLEELIKTTPSSCVRRVEEAFRVGASSRDAEISELKSQINSAVNWVDDTREYNDQLREQVAMLRDAATRAHRKLSAYVGVCTGDKELTNTIIPMLKEALAATEPRSTND